MSSVTGREGVRTRHRRLRGTLAVVSLLFAGLVATVLVDERPAAAQAAPIVGEDIVPCSFTPGDPYVMTLDICRAWGRLQNLAIQRVEQFGGLTSGRTLTLTRGRTAVQAMLWTIVSEAAVKPPSERSADERLALDWLTQVVHQHNIRVSERALEMHDEFYEDERPGPGSTPCTFTPPFPYELEYPGSNKTRESFCFAGAFPDVFGIGVTNKPKAGDWLKWAGAEVMASKFSASAGAIARDMAAQMAVLGAMAAGGVAAAVLTPLIATQTIVISANVAANIAIGTGLVGGVGIALFIALGIIVYVLAVVAAVYGTIIIFQDERPALVTSLNEALKPIDIGTLIASTSGAELAFTLFSGWLGTAATPGTSAPIPARVGSDPRFTVTPQGGTTSGIVDSFTIQDAAGNPRTVTMQGGYWVITDANGTTASTSLPGFDRQGKPGVITRSRQADGSFGFVAVGAGVTCNGTTQCEARRDFDVVGAGGTRTTIRYAGTQDGQDLPPLTFDFDKVSTATMGVPASLFVAAFDTNGTRVSATYTWQIGNRCLTRWSTGCPIVPDGPDQAPDGSPIATAGVGQGLQYSFTAPGRWWMRVRATTAAGDTFSNWFTVDVANPAPTLSLTSPVTGEVVCSSNGDTTCPPIVLGPLGGLGVTGLVTDVASSAELASILIDWGDGNVEWGDSSPDTVFCPRPGQNGTETFVPCVNFGGLDGENRPFSATYSPNPELYGNRTLRVTVRDSGGNTATLTAPYVVPDPRQTQTVEIDPAPSTSWGEPIDLNATASSELPVTFTASPENWCVVDDGMLYGARAGECVVTATQAGDATFQPASASRTFTFTARSGTFTFPQPDDTVLPVDPAFRLPITATLSDAFGDASPGNVEMLSRTPVVCTVDGFEVRLLIVGACILRARITPGTTNWTASVVERTFQVLPQPTLPGAPTGVTTSFVRANTRSVSFVPPVDTGNGTIASYRAVCSSSNGGAEARSASGSTSPLVVSGLTTGATYRCRVNATNEAGTGPGSLPSASFVAVGAPDAPTGVSAVESGPGALTVSFTPPASDGGMPLIGHVAVCSSPTGVTRRVTGKGSPITVGSLSGGSTYTCVAHATSDAGTGGPSAPSAPVLVRTAPSAPTGVLASPTTATRALVSFFRSDSDGGSPITAYRTLCTSPTGQPRGAAGTAGPLDVGGLTAGATYRCVVTATNAIGTSASSVQTSPFVALGFPGAPTGVSAVEAGSGTLRVSFTPPVADGGAPLSGAVAVCSSPTGVTRRVVGFTSPITVSALTGGATYTCVAHATTSAGTGPASAPASAVLVRSVPGPPTSVVATSTGPTRASVAFGPPASSGGSPVTSYRVVCTSPTGAARTVNGTASPLVVSTLTAGATYTCRASATNVIGTGTASAAVPIGAAIPI
jgi:hypothetical protein